MAGALRAFGTKTKLPLQVLAVTKGNSEKLRFGMKHVMGIWDY
jgi:hypothetical protein